MDDQDADDQDADDQDADYLDTGGDLRLNGRDDSSSTELEGDQSSGTKTSAGTNTKTATV